VTTQADATFADFDVFDPDLPPRFYEVMHDARSRCPVAHTETDGGYWLVTRYDDVKAVLSDPSTFSSVEGVLPVGDPGVAPWLIHTDPPLQRDLRQLFNRFFSTRHLEPHVPAMHAIAQQLLDGFASTGRSEIIADFAAPYTAGVLATVVFGLDHERYLADLLEWADVNETAAARGERQNPANQDFLSRVLTEIVEERRSSNVERDDVVQAVINGEVAGRPLTHEEAFGNLHLFIGAGVDTAKAAIGSIVYRLTEDPSLEPRLRESSWTDAEIDEFLRLDAPLTGLGRLVAVDTELGGQQLKAGERVWVLYASANRDDGVYPEPDRLDFDRPRNTLMTFGAGVHRCVGAPLARLEIAVAMNELLGRAQNIRRADDAEVQWTPGLFRRPASLSVVFDPVAQ
jgi:cytochrome P450